MEKLGQQAGLSFTHNHSGTIEDDVRLRAALNKDFVFLSCVKKDVAKAPRSAPFGYAEPLPRNQEIWLKYQGHFTLNLVGFLSLSGCPTLCRQ